MAQLATIFIVAVGALVFGLFVPLARLYQALPQMVTALSIIAAALFVRLNRGMPSIDWKSVEPNVRKKLTGQMQAITGEYVVILAVAAALTGLLVGLQVIGLEYIKIAWLDITQRAVTAIVGGLVALSVARMGYVVWRDYDIVRTQRAVLDAAADADQAEREGILAEKKIAAIKGAGLRAVPRSDLRPWEE